jgi:hypothetical protein
MLLKKYGQLWFDKTCNMGQNALNGANDVTSYKDCKVQLFPYKCIFGWNV